MTGHRLEPLLLSVVVLLSCGAHAGDGSTVSGENGRAERVIEAPVRLQNLPFAPKRFRIDGHGRLVFASIEPTGETNQLLRYDPQIDSIEAWPLPHAPGGGWFVGLDVDEDDGIWIGWDQTLTHVSEQGRVTDVIEVPVETAYQVDHPAGFWIRDLRFVDGDIWLSRQHARSILVYKPNVQQFVEHDTMTVGVPDRLERSADGTVWFTVSQDDSRHEYTRLGVLRNGIATAIEIAASSIAFDRDRPVVAEPRAGIGLVDVATQRVLRRSTPFPMTASGIVAVSDGGHYAIANRSGSKVAILDAATGQWSVTNLPTRTERIHKPPLYHGPEIMTVTAEVTDAHFDASGRLWLAIPTYGQIVAIR